MKSFKTYLALVLTLFFWSSAFVGIRIGLHDYSPGALALLRFIVGSFCMALIYHWLPNKKPMSWLTRGQLMLVGMGAIGVYNICLNFGEMTVSAGIASFVVGLIPVFTIIFSYLVLKEKLNRGVWFGVLISLAGLLLMLVAEESHGTFDVGMLIILISAVMGGMYNVSQKFFLGEFHPIAVTAWVIWGGTLLLMWFAPNLVQEFPKASAHATWTVIYMGVCPAAIAYACWCYVLSVWPASKTSMCLYAMPILSTLMGSVILHEAPSRLSLLGGFIALLGAITANYLRNGFTLGTGFFARNADDVEIVSD